MGLLDFILQECMDWLHDAHRDVWTVLMLLLLAFLGGCTAILFLARHWGGRRVPGHPHPDLSGLSDPRACRQAQALPTRLALLL